METEDQEEDGLPRSLPLLREVQEKRETDLRKEGVRELTPLLLWLRLMKTEHPTKSQRKWVGEEVRCLGKLRARSTPLGSMMTICSERATLRNQSIGDSIKFNSINS